MAPFLVATPQYNGGQAMSPFDGPLEEMEPHIARIAQKFRNNGKPHFVFAQIPSVTFSYHACTHFHTRIIRAVALGKMVLASPKAILESTNLPLVKDMSHSLSYHSWDVISTRMIHVLNLLSHMSDGCDIEGFSQRFLALPGIDGVDSLMNLLYMIQSQHTYHVEPNSPYAELLLKICCSFRPSIINNSSHKSEHTQKLVQECLSQMRQYSTEWLKHSGSGSNHTLGDTYRAEFEEAERRGGVLDIFFTTWQSISCKWHW